MLVLYKISSKKRQKRRRFCCFFFCQGSGKKKDKKRFEKALHQLGSAFEKAKEVNKINLPNETKQLVKKQHIEIRNALKVQRD